VLGGTQSLHANGRERRGVATENRPDALRTQQIIAAESGVANTVDPVPVVRDRDLTNAIEQGAGGIYWRESSAPAARSWPSRRGLISAKSRNRPIGADGDRFTTRWSSA